MDGAIYADDSGNPGVESGSRFFRLRANPGPPSSFPVWLPIAIAFFILMGVERSAQSLKLCRGTERLGKSALWR